MTTTVPSWSSARRGTPPAWPRPPSGTSGCTARPTSSAASSPGSRPGCRSAVAIGRFRCVEPSPAWRRRDGLPILTWPLLEGTGAAVVVTTREGGVSAGPYRWLDLALHVGDEPEAVLENRRRAAGALGAALDDLVIGARCRGTGTSVVATSDAAGGPVRWLTPFPGWTP